MHDLNGLVKDLPADLGYVIVAAVAINDQGQIAANCADATHTLLLTPVIVPLTGVDLLLMD